jgi:hypothetical protein
VYNNTEWVTVGVQEITVIVDDQFNGDDVTTAFTLSSSGTTAGVIVSINGIQQVPTSAYSVSSTTLTFTEAPATGDLIDVRILTTTTTVTGIVDGTSSVDIDGINGNVVLEVGGTDIAVYHPGGENITGAVSATGTVTGSQFNGSGAGLTSIPGANVTGTVPSATSATTAGTVTTAAQGNITSVGTLTGLNSSGAISTAGTVTGTSFVGVATSAQYADLAEKYTADAEYAPGTVVSFGGDAEVTASTDADTRVAGVVSTNPAFTMNNNLVADHVVTVAFTGRVPCRVAGTVRKGDLMVSAGNGLARAESNPAPGTIIGKALANHDGAEGTIEVVVGRF